METVDEVDCSSMTVDEVDGCRWLVVDDLRDHIAVYYVNAQRSCR